MSNAHPMQISNSHNPIPGKQSPRPPMPPAYKTCRAHPSPSSSLPSSIHLQQAPPHLAGCLLLPTLSVIITAATQNRTR